jgi:hypothetical protein
VVLVASWQSWCSAQLMSAQVAEPQEPLGCRDEQDHRHYANGAIAPAGGFIPPITGLDA